MAKIFCVNCGQLIPESANYCYKCGAAQKGAEAAQYRASGPIVEQATVPSPEVRSATAQTDPRIAELLTKYSTKHKLSPDARLAFVISYMFKTSVLIALFIIGVVLEPLWVGLAAGLYFLVLFLIAQVAYDNYFFKIDENGFQKEYGFVHKMQVSIPYQHIQNVNISRTFLDRLIGLSRINLETAGSSSITSKEVVGGSMSKAEAHLPGVKLAMAQEIHDLLLAKANEAQGND